MKRIASCGLGLTILLVIGGMPAGAQSQSSSSSQAVSSAQSLGEYAKHVRKAPEPGGKPKVFDNDNLPKNDRLSIVGKPAPAASEQNSAESKAENTAPAAGEGMLSAVVSLAADGPRPSAPRSQRPSARGRSPPGRSRRRRRTPAYRAAGPSPQTPTGTRAPTSAIKAGPSSSNESPSTETSSAELGMGM